MLTYFFRRALRLGMFLNKVSGRVKSVPAAAFNASASLSTTGVAGTTGVFTGVFVGVFAGVFAGVVTAGVIPGVVTTGVCAGTVGDGVGLGVRVVGVFGVATLISGKFLSMLGAIGKVSDITGTSVYYAGGGGGGQAFDGPNGQTTPYWYLQGLGGTGGGGNGGATNGQTGFAGTANTGGGGGGGANIPQASGAAGGSGIVIIRY